VLFYETATGRRPVFEALEELEDDEQARVLESVEAFTEEFPRVQTVTIRPLVGKLWEMRSLGEFECCTAWWPGFCASCCCS
jgi:hypothetical protein